MPERTIRDVIVDRPILTASPLLSVREAVLKMVQARVGALMLVKNGRLAGIFTERDALVRVIAARLDPDTTPVEAVMTAGPETIEAGKPLAHALHRMHDGGFRHMPVVEDGVPIGMVSVRDALGPEIAQMERNLAQCEAITELL